MTPRGVALAAGVAGLLALLGASRLQLEGLRKSPDFAELLYLPSGPYLRALAVGQEETLADLLYIWSIQYYSDYTDDTRYKYLDQVFSGAITELDPWFTESYIVGALIMSLEAKNIDLALKLYDKGLKAMPDNWELAYWAGWDCYYRRNYALARDYWARAAKMPDAPPPVLRLATRMLEKIGDLDAAEREYKKLLDETTDERTQRVLRNWLERLARQRAMRDAQQHAAPPPNGNRSAAPR